MAPALYIPSYSVQAYAPQSDHVYVVHGEHDEVIPSSSTKKLFERFGKGVASMKVIPATGHNTISNSSEYLAAIQVAL
mgnify:CR=1 FL=1